MKVLGVLSLFLLISCKPSKIKIPEPLAVAEEESADIEVETESDEVVEEESSSADALPVSSQDTEVLNAMKGLDGVSLEMPCKDFVATKIDCTTVADITKSIVVGGDAAKVYEVEIRVRGAVEPMTYSGGASDGGYFYTGGTFTNKDFNIYSVSTEKPKQVYYLNSKAAVGGFIDAVDYKVKIKVNGASTVKLFAGAQNGTIIANVKPVTVPDITIAADVRQGQFVRLNVLSVQEVNGVALRLRK